MGDEIKQKGLDFLSIEFYVLHVPCAGWPGLISRCARASPSFHCADRRRDLGVEAGGTPKAPTWRLRTVAAPGNPLAAAGA